MWYGPGDDPSASASSIRTPDAAVTTDHSHKLAGVTSQAEKRGKKSRHGSSKITSEKAAGTSQHVEDACHMFITL